MTYAKRYRFLLGLLIVLSLVCIAGIVFFFTRMYQRDMKSLTDFMASYRAYDRAVVAASALVFDANGKSASAADAEEHQADEALSGLRTKSSVRISSLIKNEQEAMRVMQEIADLSEKEMRTLRAYRQATGQDAQRTRLAQTFHDLTKERQAAFAHFQELGR
jgi:FlaA1/EpsC-like NDP-sugar epimerase